MDNNLNQSYGNESQLPTGQIETTIPPQTLIQKIISKFINKSFLITISVTACFYGACTFLFIPLTYVGITTLLLGNNMNTGLGFLILSNFFVIFLWAFVNGLILYFVLKKLRFLFIGFFLFILYFVIMFISLGTINDIVSKRQIAKYTKSVEEAVGKEPMIITYSTSEQSYDSDNLLDKLEVTFDIVTPETGDYSLSAYLATAYDIYGPAKQSVPKADTSSSPLTVNLKKSIPSKVTFTFNMDSFVLVEYADNLKLTIDARRLNLNIKSAFNYDKTPTTTYPVKLKDSGVSKNFVVSNRRGIEEPVYTVGPFEIKNPKVTIIPTENIPIFIPLPNWKKIEAEELTFYYPGEWEAVSLPLREIPKSVQFKTPEGDGGLSFTVSSYPALAEIKGLKEAGKFTIQTVSLQGKNVTKLGEVGRTEIIIFSSKNGHITFLSNISHDLFYQILGTIKFNSQNN